MNTSGARPAAPVAEIGGPALSPGNVPTMTNVPQVLFLIWKQQAWGGARDFMGWRGKGGGGWVEQYIIS
jgi:hypothetical protein